MKTTIKTNLDVPVMVQGGVSIEEWPCEIDCRFRGGEPRTEDNPGSPPTCEIVDVRFFVRVTDTDGVCLHLDYPETIEYLIPYVHELALSKLTQEIIGRYDSEMEARRQRDD